MRFTLEIELGNDAMQDASNVAEALERVANVLDADSFGDGKRFIADANGNTVGKWEVTGDSCR